MNKYIWKFCRYAINDLSPNYDPAIEDLTKKIEDLTDELQVIRTNLRKLKYGNDLKLLKTIDTQIQRLQVTFDAIDEPSQSDFESKSAENVCDETFQGMK